MRSGARPRYRGALFEQLRQRAHQPKPFVITGPPGAGKTTLLLSLADALRADGFEPVVLDLFGAASSPSRFVSTAAAAMPPGTDVRELQRLATSGRANGPAAVERLLDVWATANGTALLLDEATEIRSIAYFPGMREIDAQLGAALAVRRGPTVLASSFATRAGRLWPAMESIPLPPLDAADMAAAGLDARTTCGSFGWPRYVDALADALAQGCDAPTAWAGAMERGGRLETLCRATYESLLLRSRGYGISKAVLATVAEHEGLTLTELLPLVGRTAGATRDYLGWLVEVDLLRFERKRYAYADPMLREWVKLHATGHFPTAEDLARAAAAACGVEAPASPPPTPRARPRDVLMEID